MYVCVCCGDMSQPESGTSFSAAVVGWLVGRLENSTQNNVGSHSADIQIHAMAIFNKIYDPGIFTNKR